MLGGLRVLLEDIVPGESDDLHYLLSADWEAQFNCTESPLTKL